MKSLGGVDAAGDSTESINSQKEKRQKELSEKPEKGLEKVRRMNYNEENWLENR